MYVCMHGWMDGCMYLCMYVNTNSPNLTNRSATHFKLGVVFMSAPRRAACPVVRRFLVSSGSVGVHVS